MHGWSPTLCHLYLFAGSEDRVSLDYLTRLQARLYGSTIEEQESYITSEESKKRSRCGHYKLPDHVLPILKELALVQPMLSHVEIAERLSVAVGDGFPIVDKNTIKDAIKREGITKKQTTRYSKLLSISKRYETLLITLAIKPIKFLFNMDATSCNRWKFLQKEGRIYIGKECLQYDWSFIEKALNACSTLAVYTERGWASWKHSTGTIDADFVSKYILNDIASYVTENSVLLHDGASVHTAEVSVGAIGCFFKDDL